MCVIAVAYKKDPKLSDLYRCESTNPHGGGVAWAEKGFVHFKKGLKAEEMQELVANKPFPHVFHFRIASVGKVIPALCHPFIVKRKHNCDMAGVTNSPVLFHNGTMGDWRFMAKLAGVTYPEFASDSMVMARIISVRGHDILNHLVQGNKFTVLHPDGQVKNYGQFTRIDENDYSNGYWSYGSPSTYYGRGQQQGHGKQAGEGDWLPEMGDMCGTGNAGDKECPECHKRNVDKDNTGQFLCNNCYFLWTEVDGEVKSDSLPAEGEGDVATVETPPAAPPAPPSQVSEEPPPVGT